MKAPKKIEVSIRREIVKTLGFLFSSVAQQQSFLNGELTPEQSFALIDTLQDKWKNYFLPDISTSWVSSVSALQKEKMQTQLKKALGVQTAYIFDDQKTREVLQLANLEASELIKTIPQEFFEKIRQATIQNYKQIPFAGGGSLTDEIKKIYDVTQSRAKVIARDQTSKITTALNQSRNEDLGISRYIWRTSKDSRVVGAPGGMYPEGNKVHGNHYAREGKIFEWAKPPYDGHPGYAINCRCYAEPLINTEELNLA